MKILKNIAFGILGFFLVLFDFVMEILFNLIEQVIRSGIEFREIVMIGECFVDNMTYRLRKK